MSKRRSKPQSKIDLSKRKGKLVIIGVDPDVEKMGVCSIDKRNGEIHTELIHWYDFVAGFVTNDFRIIHNRILVRVEAGWLNPKSNYRKGGSPEQREKIAHDVGRNHQVGIMICEVCWRLGIDYEEVVPENSKEERKKMVNAFLKKDLTNQEMIDAAYLVIGM